MVCGGLLQLTARFSFSECFPLGSKEIVIDFGCLVRDVSVTAGFFFTEVRLILCSRLIVYVV